MTRRDFVSNSSSSSFIVFEHFKDILKKYVNNTLKYKEFIYSISYYENFVFRMNWDLRHKYEKEIDQFLYFLNKTCSCTVLERYDTPEFNNYLSKNLEKYGVQVKVKDHVKKQYIEYDKYEYTYFGKKYDDLYDLLPDVVSEIKNEIKYIHINNITVLLTFLNLNNLMDMFINCVDSMFVYKEGDEYDTFPLPAELEILLKYNKEGI